MDQILTLVAKLLFKAIKLFVDYSAWQGYFVLTSEETKLLSASDAEEMAKNSFKKTVIKCFENIKYDLESKGLSSKEQEAFVASFTKRIKNSEPLLYLAFSVNKLSDDVDRINDSLKIVLEEAITSRIIFDSIDDIDNELIKSSNNKVGKNVGIDFYDFQDESFSGSLKEKADILKQKSIFISGRYRLETLYATLFELKKLYAIDYCWKVIVINDAKELLKIKEGDFDKDSIIVLCDSYLEQNDLHDLIGVRESPPYQIIVVSSLPRGADTVVLSNRLANNTFNKFKECGFSTDDANEILRIHGNNFPQYFPIIYSVSTLGIEGYLEKYSDEAIATSALLPKWEIDNPSDQSIINQIYGASYKLYLNEIKHSEIPNNPFSKTTSKYSRKVFKIVSLNDPAIFVKLVDRISNKSINHFFELFYQIATKTPNNYLDENNMFSADGRDFSSSLREAAVRTFVFLSNFYDDGRSKADSTLKRIIDFNKQNGLNQSYFAKLLYDLVEACPNVVLEQIELDVRNKGAILKLFLDDKNNSTFFTNGYTYILWALEKLLFLNSLRNRALRVLFELCKEHHKYQISNSPKNTLVTALLAWLRTTSMSSDDKKEFTKFMFESDRETAFDIVLSLQYEQHSSAAPFNPPQYLNYDVFDNKTLYQDEAFDLYQFYSNSLIQNLKSPNECAEVIKKNVFLYYGIDYIKSSLKAIVKTTNNFNDLDKELVADQLRKFIHMNRYYASSDWAAGEKIVQLYSEALEEIRFEHEETQYLHYFKRNGVYLPNPGKYETHDYLAEQDQLKSIIREKSNEFISKNLNLDYLTEVFVADIHKDNAFPSFEFSYLFVEYYVQKNILNRRNATIKLLKTFEQDSNFVRWVGFELARSDKNTFFDILESFLEDNALLYSLLYCYQFDVNDLTFISFFKKALNRKQRTEFFRNIPKTFYVSKNLESLEYILKGIAHVNFRVKEKNAFCEVLFSFITFYRDIVDYSKVLSYMKLASDSILLSSNDIYQLVEIIEKLQSYYSGTEDNEIISYIAHLEFLITYCGYQPFKALFLTNSLSRDANEYFELIKYLYDSKSKLNKRVKGKLYFYLFYQLRFLPGYVDNLFDQGIFNNWVDSYKELLLSNTTLEFKGEDSSPTKFYYYTLGKLCGNFSSFMAVDFFPKSIATFIENISEEYVNVFNAEFEVQVHNNIGIRTIDCGKDLLELSNKYRELSIKFNDYANTSKLMKLIASSLEKWSKEERMAAEEYDD